MKLNANALTSTENPFERGQRKPDRDLAVRQASYLVADTTPSKVDLNSEIPGFVHLEVDHIDTYAGDPRLFGNENEADIEASLRAQGFHGSLTVTRRGPADRYMLAAGSNTTLRILKRLYAETKDERYRWINCIFQPYQSETKLLAQHLGENLNRGDMKFWEIAKGIVELVDAVSLERQESDPQAKPLGLREHVEFLHEKGIKGNKSDMALWRFSVTRLAKLGPALPHLTNLSVRSCIQPRLSGLLALAVKFRVAEEQFWGQVVDPTLKEYGSEVEQSAGEAPFDANDLCDRVESAFAEHVCEPVHMVRQMLSVLKKSPTLTLSDLRVPSPNLLAGTGGNSAELRADVEAHPAVAHKPSEPLTQSPLPLGPAQVRGQGVSPPAEATPSRTTRAAAVTAPGTGQTAATEQRPSSDGALFSQAPEATAGDPLQQLHSAVETLLELAGLGDVICWRDQMPLGFFIDLPDRAKHQRRKVSPGSPEQEAQRVKTMVWWTLAEMNCQFRQGCVPFMDHDSAFFRHHSDASEESPLQGTEIDTEPPEPDDMMIFRLSPGPGLMRQAIRQLRHVEELAAVLFEQRPERWRRMLEAQRKDT